MQEARFPMEKSDEEWKQELSPEAYRVLRRHGTEPPGTSPLNGEKRSGMFLCAACGAELFGSNTKYDSGSGWPSFYRPKNGEAVATSEDRSLLMRRTEVHCARCGGHLGHVFADGPAPTGQQAAGGLMFAAARPTGTAQEIYRELCLQARGLFEGERDPIANAANLSALLYGGLEDVNWVGFYFLKGGDLVLGPFQGRPACIRIPVGQGVCGTAAQRREAVIVPDVEKFPGHIACDTASRSEIVTPLLKSARLLGVLDVDSPDRNRFNEADRAGLETLAGLWVESSDHD
jgi:L-methionine (R)-S-oxide reductase